MPDHEAEREAIEIALLLEGVYQYAGYDFRQYSEASLRRRIWNVVHAEGLMTVSGLQEKVLHDPGCMERFLAAICVNVTAMFRDPAFFRLFRQKVVPCLRTYPSVHLWIAGCSSGEEAYSLAILLEEEGLADRCRIYATDISAVALHQAGNGSVPLDMMKDYTRNYLAAGGTRAFSEYYTVTYGNAIMRPSLRTNIVFAQHNLASDGAFNTFHVIWCRNVLIYFGKALQDRVHDLLYTSLIPLGVLGLGHSENLRFTPHESHYSVLADNQPFYRKTGTFLHLSEAENRFQRKSEARAVIPQG